MRAVEVERTALRRTLRSSGSGTGARCCRRSTTATRVARSLRSRLLDQAPGTIKGYLYDPTGEKARATKARYRGSCASCGAPTSGADGKGRAARHCQRCKPQSVPRWTRDMVRAAHRRWYERYGFIATTYDWSGTHARRRGAPALARYESGDWPSGPVIRRLYGSAANARADAFPSPA
jgi:hypothetical protein